MPAADWRTSPPAAHTTPMPRSLSCKSVARTLQSGVADQAFTVEITDSFPERLDSIEAFLAEAEALFAFDELLAELRAKVFPNLKRFPRIGRRYLDQPPQSAEALAQLAELLWGAADALREYLHGDYLILYALAESTAYLLSIRHH